MRVLRLTPHYYFEAKHWPSRFDPLGGMQVQITNMSQWLSKQGIEQEVLTTGFSGVPRYIKDNDCLEIHSVRFMTLPFKSKYTGTLFLDASWGLGVIKWLITKGNRKKFDLIHIHASGVSWPLMIGIITQKILKIPVVVTIHCSRNFTYEPMNKYDLLIHKTVKKLEKRLILKAHTTILLTDRVKDKYTQIFPHIDKFTCIGDCVAPYHLDNSENICNDGILEQLGIPQYSKIVLYVGRIAFEKGWDTFVNIANELKDDKNLFFLVCGDGPQREEMEKEILRLGLHDKFKITGFVSHRIIPSIMAYASVLVMPSRHEELGGTALEAIVAGLPVVASKVGGLANILADMHTAALLDYYDYKGFAQKVRYIINNPEEGKRMNKNAYNEIIPLFKPEEVYPKLIDIYKCAIGD